MIDKSLVKKLSSAGVDPAVIINLLLDEDEPEQAAEVRADPDKASVWKPLPEKTPEPEPLPDFKPEPRKDDAILAAIEKLTGAIHASNIINSSAGDPAAKETADDILAAMIRPPKNKEV